MTSDTILQDHQAERADRVGFVELFFDLVFVFAATQLSHRLAEGKGAVEVAETGVMFLAIWSVWTATTWVTNWLDVERNSVRLLLFALMLGEGLGERGAAETLTGAVLGACSNGTQTPDMLSRGLGATTRRALPVSIRWRRTREGNGQVAT